MKRLSFSDEPSYIYNEVDKSYTVVKPSRIGMFEMLWGAINHSPYGQIDRNNKITRSEHKKIKSIKTKMRSISHFKDKDQDSRILLDPMLTVFLEEEEYLLLIKLLEANSFQAAISEEVATLWEIIEDAEEVDIQKLTSLK